MKPKRETVELTRIELQAALEACSNYTPGAHRRGWKQAAQTRVVNKLQLALQRIDRNARRWS